MTVPTDHLLSRGDLDFQLFEWLEVDELTSRERYTEHSRDTFEAVLDLSAQLATEQFAPHNKLNDAREPQFIDGRVKMNAEVKQALDVVAEAGLIGAGMDETVGGLQLPHVIQTACSAWFQAANISSWGYALLTIANANLLLAHGSKEQVETFVKPMIAGRFHGTMCLSEPQAGSSLADITTRAEPQDDGTYRIVGNKMWISGGDHELGENIVHLVLAKIPGGPPGVKGISLFIVPKYLANPDGSAGERNDVVLAGLNHKMGFRGTTNAMLNFGEGVYRPGGSAGAVGYLVGEPHRGLAYMFHMMNEARVAVGAGAASLGYTGYRKSLDYARTRLQGRPRGATSDSPQSPIIDHADVRRMLLAQKSYVEGALGLVLFCGKLLDEQRTAQTPEEHERVTALLEVLTPIAKSWPSQWCLAANDLAIQVLGGYGYTREYDVEQHYRDNRLNPIHEGTHGIQGIDLLGRKVTMGGGSALDALVCLLRSTIDRASAVEEAEPLATQLDQALTDLLKATHAIHSADVDITTKLANASLYLEASGHLVVAWVWLEQFLAATDPSNDLHRGKRLAAKYFFTYELPKTAPQIDVLLKLDTTTVDADPCVF